MDSVETLLAIFGSVLAISLSVFFSIVKATSGKQKAICKEQFREITKWIDKQKQDSGSYMTRNDCMITTNARDRAIEERFGSARKIVDLEFARVYEKIARLEEVQAEKLSNIIDRMGIMSKTLEDISRNILHIKKNGTNGK